jgi:hypothetical protein
MLLSQSPSPLSKIKSAAAAEAAPQPLDGGADLSH